MYDRTEISVQPQDRKFTAVGIVEVESGWREALGEAEEPRPAKDDSAADARLPAWPDGTAVRVVEAGTDRKTTKPPPRYTEGSLIKAMQEAWRFADDPDQAARLKEAKGIGTPATRDTIIEGLKRQALLEVEKKKLKASGLPMAVYALLRNEAPEVLDPAATAEMELALDEILSAKNEAGAVVSSLVARAVAFNEKMRSRGESGKPLDVTVNGSNGGTPSPAALAFANKIAGAIGGEIPKETLVDRNLLSQWIDRNKTKLPDGPSAKQVAFARSISERKRIAIEPAALQSRAALSTWISTHT